MLYLFRRRYPIFGKINVKDLIKKRFWMVLYGSIILIGLFIAFYPRRLIVDNLASNIIKFIEDKKVEESPVEALDIAFPVLASVPPHTHPPGQSELKHTIVAASQFVVPQDMWYLGTDTGELKNAPVTILHHAEITIYGEKMLSDCPPDYLLYVQSSQSVFNKLKARYPSGFGKFLKRGTVLRTRLLLHNNTGETYRDVSFSVRAYTIPARKKNVIKPIQYFVRALSDGKCGSSFVVPAKTTGFIKTSDLNNPLSYLRIPEDGELIYLHSHFHYPDGGRSVSVYLNGKALFEFVATITNNTERAGWFIPGLWGRSFIREVKEGDLITFAARYDNVDELPVPDAEGYMYIYFLPNQPEGDPD